MNKQTTPPHMTKEDKVILFDGVCKLCHFWSQFTIKYDKKRVFKLASVQSPEGQRILAHFGMPTDQFDTMLYIENNLSHEKSDAFLKIIRQFPLPWRALFIFSVIPKAIRDWGYDRIALNRYVLFGKYDQCILPTADHKSRFLNPQE